jgi:hypothetical protein
MPKKLPSNVPIINEGHITLIIPRGDILFLDDPPADNIERTASILKYGELWRDAVYKRFPRTTVYARMARDDELQNAATFEISPNHPKKDALAFEAMRLAVDTHKKVFLWHVRKGSPEEMRIRKHYEKQTEAQLDERRKKNGNNGR